MLGPHQINMNQYIHIGGKMKNYIAGALVLGLIVTVGAQSFGQDAQEQELIVALQSADTPDADKALACKQLAVHGSAASVPVLAPLLSDERFASWARIPLEVIPGEEADAAFRDAASNLSGRLLIGTLNSIGVRRDAAAVDVLKGRLANEDADISTAAAVALGRIGNKPAAEVLKASLENGAESIRAAAADGAVLCAEHLHRAGKSEMAVAIYDQVRHADVPKQRVIEATRGAILARGEDGIPLLVEQLQSPDPDLYAIGLFTAREVSGAPATEALVNLLQDIAPQRQAALLLVLADRGDRDALPTVMQFALDGPSDSRLASIRTLERLGDVSCVQALLDISTEDEPGLSAAAKTAIEKIADDRVDADLVGRLAKSEGKIKRSVIEVIGKRRIEAYADLRTAAEDSDGETRRAALLALGSTIELQNLDFLIDQVVAPTHTPDTKAAATALRDASVRMHEREACAAQLSTALAKGSTEAKQTILKILGEMQGAKALETLGKTAREGSPVLQDTSSRLLGEWMTVDASTELIKLAKQPGPYQVRALRGYLRLARQFLMPAEQRTQMCRTALATAKRDEERKLALSVLQRYASVANLKVAAEVVKMPSLKEDAVNTVRAIANKVGADKPEVKDVLAKAGVSLLPE